ncbi:hypothetical protein KUTeg_020640 [Tegillarca granosa]|uniref:Contactin n=1 Tax=Tegillarca granosa TaxID=220873 RepID=A0ABQ9E8H9_TEGGR|nr:hypothetical protein KUTeg_020640 [Tegillarca granosa]
MQLKMKSDLIFDVSYVEIIGGYGWTRVIATEALTLAYICEIPEKESWRIKKEDRDFTYGTAFSDPNLAPKGPKFFKQPANTEILGYTSLVYFECLASSLPSPKYEWFTSKNGSTEIITYKTDKRYTVTSGRLSIEKPSERIDSGNYWCTGENVYGKVMSAPAFLSFAYLGEFSNVDTANVNPLEYQGTVILCPNIPYRSSGASSVINAKIQDSFIQVFPRQPLVGQTITLECLAYGTGNVTIICNPEAAPYPEYMWLRNNVNMNLRPGDTSSRIRMLPNGNLLITNVQQSDEGFYTCRVKNNIGQAESSTKLIILSGTTLQQKPIQRDAQVNSTAFFPCRASYNPELDLIYSWLLNDNPIDFKKDTSYKMSSTTAEGDANTGGLYVRNVQYYHEGVYTCVARTSVDEARGSAKLNVLGPPGQPVGVILDKDPTVGPRAVRVQWTDGDEHGDTIQFYLIQGKTDYSKKWEFLRSNIRRQDTAIPGNVNKRTALVQNLKPGVAYQFRVIAINSYGIGQPSFPSGWKQIQPARPIKAVDYVGGGGGKVGNLFIYWTPLSAEDLNGDDIGYLVKWRMKRNVGEGDSKWEEQRVYGNARNFTTMVGANFFYLPYDVTVTAFNKNGTADAFTSAVVYSAEDMPVGVPRNVYAKPYNSTALTVHWNPVPNNRETMKGVLLGYKVNYWKRYGETEFQAIQAIFDNGDGHRKSAVIIGLQANEWYYVSVIAYNSAGNGPKTPQLYPTEVHVWSHGADSVFVTFRGVTSQKGEDPLRGYKIRYWKLNEDIRLARDIDVERANHGTIYGLKDGLVYRLRVWSDTNRHDSNRNPSWSPKINNNICI